MSRMRVSHFVLDLLVFVLLVVMMLAVRILSDIVRLIVISS